MRRAAALWPSENDTKRGRFSLPFIGDNKVTAVQHESGKKPVRSTIDVLKLLSSGGDVRGSSSDAFEHQSPVKTADIERKDENEHEDIELTTPEGQYNDRMTQYSDLMGRKGRSDDLATAEGQDNDLIGRQGQYNDLMTPEGEDNELTTAEGRHDDQTTESHDLIVRKGQEKGLATAEVQNNDLITQDSDLMGQKGQYNELTTAEGQGNELTQKGHEMPTDERYFTTVWCKKSARKHKKWEGDAVLIVRKQSVILKDMNGKDIGKGMGYKKSQLQELEEGKRLTIGAKEVEIMDQITAEKFSSGRCFASQSPSSTTGSDAVE